MTATTKEMVEFVGGALRWLLNVGVVVMLFFGVAIMLWTLGLRARGGRGGASHGNPQTCFWLYTTAI